MLKKIVLNGLAIHDLGVTSAPTYWVDVDGIEGLGEPQFRLSSYQNAGEDGGTVGSGFYGMRVISLAGMVQATDVASFNLARRTLEAACATRKDSAGRLVAKTVTFTTLDDAQFFVDAHVQTCKVAVRQPTSANFLIQLLCPAPQLFDPEQASSGQIGRPATSGGAIYPVTYPVTYGTTTGGVVTVVNDGNMDTWPLLTLRGPLATPTILYQEKSKTFQLNTNLIAGDIVVIDMKEKTIVKNGTTSLLAAKTTDSDWFSFQSGDNTLRFLTSSTSDTGTLEATFYPAYLGI